MRLLAELTEFILHRKAYWLIPILMVMLIFGGLVVISQGTAIGPFIYTIF